MSRDLLTSSERFYSKQSDNRHAVKTGIHRPICGIIVYQKNLSNKRHDSISYSSRDLGSIVTHSGSAVCAGYLADTSKGGGV